MASVILIIYVMYFYDFAFTYTTEIINIRTSRFPSQHPDLALENYYHN